MAGLLKISPADLEALERALRTAPSRERLRWADEVFIPYIDIPVGGGAVFECLIGSQFSNIARQFLSRGLIRGVDFELRRTPVGASSQLLPGDRQAVYITRLTAAAPLIHS